MENKKNACIPSQTMSFFDTLQSFGITEDTLTQEEKHHLDEKGYLLLQKQLNPQWVEELKVTIEHLFQVEGESAGTEYIVEAGTRRLSALMNKGSVFDELYINCKVLAATWRLLGRDFRLDMLNARDVMGGHGHQKLHTDWGVRQPGEPHHAVNTIWMLDDFTERNGATRLVPGTHQIYGPVREHLTDPFAPHPEEILVIAPAGSVLVYSAHVWHGGTLNQSEGHRRCLHSFYCANEHERYYQQIVEDETLKRISPIARFLLGQ